MRSIAKILLPVALAALLAGCSDEPEPTVEPVAAEAPAASEAPPAPREEPKPTRGVVTSSGPVMDVAVKELLVKTLARGHRDPHNVARDPYRHPLETLEFFGLQRGMHVVEITPAPGYFTELLAPVLKNRGRYIAATWDESVPDQPSYRADLNREFEIKMRPRKHYGHVQIVKFDPRKPKFGETGSADMVLSFRNAHNWIEEGTAPAYFRAAADVLKSGGVLGIVDHRAPEGAPTDGSKGYVTEEQIIELAVTAGFVLADRSEVNANPKDTKDHPEGVWTLPPSYALGATDRDKYTAIGESDRMTLKFLRL